MVRGSQTAMPAQKILDAGMIPKRPAYLGLDILLMTGGLLIERDLNSDGNRLYGLYALD